MMILLSIGVLLALAVSAFCSGMETGLLSVRRERVLHVAREGSVRAKIISEAISSLASTTTAILVGNNLANVCYSSAVSALIATLCAHSSSMQFALSSLSALVILFFGEFTPKLVFSASPLRRLLAVAPVWRVFAWLFVPIGTVVANLIQRLMPRREPRTKMTPETVLKILEDRKDGVKLSDLESALIGRIMLLRARGEFVIPEALLSALDE